MIDLTGQRFGRLVAIEPVGKSNSHGVLWRCKCDCGKEVDTRANYLRNGGTTSCGCFHSEIKRAHMARSAEWNTKHGKCKRNDRHPLFGVWCTMRNRCAMPNHISYKDYGARGISVCEEWKDFQTFYDWAMSNGYKKGLHIDRIDFNGDYTPDNCRWITQAENNRNRRNTVWLTHNGETKCLVEWAKELGVNTGTMRSRLKKGWTAQEVLYGR